MCLTPCCSPCIPCIGKDWNSQTIMELRKNRDKKAKKLMSLGCLVPIIIYALIMIVLIFLDMIHLKKTIIKHNSSATIKTSINPAIFSILPLVIISIILLIIGIRQYKPNKEILFFASWNSKIKLHNTTVVADQQKHPNLVIVAQGQGVHQTGGIGNIQRNSNIQTPVFIEPDMVAGGTM